MAQLLAKRMAPAPVPTSSDLAGPAPGNIMIARHSSERHPSPVMRRSVSGHQRSRFLRLPPDCRFAIVEVRPGHNVTRVSPDRGCAPAISMTNPGWLDPVLHRSRCRRRRSWRSGWSASEIRVKLRVWSLASDGRPPDWLTLPPASERVTGNGRWSAGVASITA